MRKKIVSAFFLSSSVGLEDLEVGLFMRISTNLRTKARTPTETGHLVWQGSTGYFE